MTLVPYSLRTKYSNTCFGSTWTQNCLLLLAVSLSCPRHTSVRRCCIYCPHFPTAHSLLSPLLSGSHVYQSLAKSALAVRGAAKSWMRLQPPLERLLSSAQTLRQKLLATLFVWPHDSTFICFPPTSLAVPSQPPQRLRLLSQTLEEVNLVLFFMGWLGSCSYC